MWGFGLRINEVLNLRLKDIQSEEMLSIIGKGGKERLIPIYEENLDELIKNNISKGTLNFSLVNGDVIEESEAIFIAVGTPMDADGNTDLEILKTCIKDIKVHLR